MKSNSNQFWEMEEEQIVTVLTDKQKSKEVTIHKIDTDFDSEYQFATRLWFRGEEFIWCSKSIREAKLAAGVLKEANHNASSRVSKYGYPKGTKVPLGIASAGRQVLASYMKLFYDEDSFIQENEGTRENIANKLQVEPDTISSYWTRTRWDGCIKCGEENIENKSVFVGSDKIVVADCYECGNYYVTEDICKEEHKRTQSSCSDLIPVSAEHEGDEFKLWTCKSCGFYTTEPERYSVKDGF